jgi:hypothetical protein
MATLRGYAVKISWLGADHTYVKSSDGYVWPCWGRSSGGRNICSGSGSSSQANCISQPSSHAGIIYGITGVCHQTANRILWPSRKLVSAARGYWASSLAYGTYGSDIVAWLARIAACSLVKTDRAAKAAVMAPAKEREAAPQSAGEKSYMERLQALYEKEAAAPRTLMPGGKGGAPVELLGAELDLMLDYRLGKRVTDDAGAELKGLQQKLLAQMDSLGKGLYSNDITAAQYADRVNEQFAETLKRAVRVLGPEGYSSLFGVAVDERMLLIDPKIMVKVHK